MVGVPVDGPVAAGLLAAVALLVRFAVGLHGYSGEPAPHPHRGQARQQLEQELQNIFGTADTSAAGDEGEGNPPTFGDYEAQRHWMEITLNTPAAEWYIETPSNNLSYWGLDYPPLSAYQSLVYGQAISLVEPEAVALTTSRGYESPSSKRLMRYSVIISDLLFTLPAVVAAHAVFTKGIPLDQICHHSTRLWMAGVFVLQPAAILIDHGHFQYNNIGLGLAAGAAAAVAVEWHYVGSALFCLALNHKQMALYYAPAFFAHLLGTCLARRGLAAKALGVGRLGMVVTATFAVIWAPFLTRGPDLALKVLHRLAPIQRGLFEDYVANWWCATHIAIKWKARFSKPALWRMCTGATAIAFLPSMIQQICRPSQRGLLLCMANSAFAFFLFSYQVHEKSILLPLLPVTMMATDEPYLAALLPLVASFSMFPLLNKDGVVLAYAGAMMFFAGLSYDRLWPAKRSGHPVCSTVLVLGMTTLHAAAFLIPAPSRYPFIHDLLFVSLGFAVLASSAVYFNCRQLLLSPTDPGGAPPEKKAQ